MESVLEWELTHFFRESPCLNPSLFSLILPHAFFFFFFFFLLSPSLKLRRLELRRLEVSTFPRLSLSTTSVSFKLSNLR
ncbi:hypothetical protein C4D60_Mb07t06370 [Musa balbisiana]|uniref:Uncharacterized protein n=1 Tax=Musa balbisiana TaxID=52838 RepID=A0A4S8JDJ6_MUSBA|nr:hypothetical protein C4D60_Mb07t06370 [Musa balbisiana]